MAVAAVFTILGPILAGTAVADTVGGLISVGTANTLGILFAVSPRCRDVEPGYVVVGVAVIVLARARRGARGGRGRGRWPRRRALGRASTGGVRLGWPESWSHSPSPQLWEGLPAGWASSRPGGRCGALDDGVTRSILRGEWVTSSALAFAHGTNDAQKTMGLITLALVATGSIPSFVVPLWVKLICAIALTVGTAMGGWRIVRTLGRGIYRIRPLDGLMSQASSTLVIGGAAALGAPVSTTHVVASSVVGVGAERRWRHVRWPVVREIGLAWVVTLPACAGIGATVALLGRVVA